MHASRWGRAVLAGSLTAGVLSGATLPAVAGAAPIATATATTATAGADGSGVHVFATGNAHLSQPDDISRLGSDIFVGWQNGVGADGTPGPMGADSTVVEYQPDGTVLQEWSLVGHVDGVTADPAKHDVIATVNEDANSNLFTITPLAPAGDQVQQYQFAPNPLPHGGGTDAISVYRGAILISASNPDLTIPNAPAVYEVTLKGTTAEVQPVFFDNSSATVANTNATDQGQTVSLALTDPDSNEVVPRSTPRFGGDFVLDSQGDQQQIYVKGADGRLPQLSLLRLSQSIDDSAWVTDDDGTLFITDGADDEVVTVHGGLMAGTTVVAVTPGNANNAPPVPPPNYLGRLNLWTGQITPVITTVQAKGLLFVP